MLVRHHKGNRELGMEVLQRWTGMQASRIPRGDHAERRELVLLLLGSALAAAGTAAVPAQPIAVYAFPSWCDAQPFTAGGSASLELPCA